jgi:erythromycin esterase
MMLQKSPEPGYHTIDDWIRAESISFTPDSAESFNAAIDQVIASLGEEVRVLGFGEPLHSSNDMLRLRNRLFGRLVETHGFSAIAIESSFPRGRIVNDYVAGRVHASYEAVADTGFSHGFGRSEGNRELAEWMRDYNADPSHTRKVRFYGFDSPTEMTSSDSPRRLLQLVLGYLASVDPAAGEEYRLRIDPLLGDDTDWEDPAAMYPEKSVGLSRTALALRGETEDLIAELQVHRPGLVEQSGEDRYLDALQYAKAARQLLTYHAAVARKLQGRVARLLGMRDAMMADNLAYIASREKIRGKVLAFAHNSHLKRGKAEWQLGKTVNTWWPAGAHLGWKLGQDYAVIGSGTGSSAAHGIGKPGPGTLEAHLITAPGPARLIPTHKGRGLPAAIKDLPVRTGSAKNSTYFALAPGSITDFDWLLVLDSLD